MSFITRNLSMLGFAFAATTTAAFAGPDTTGPDVKSVSVDQVIEAGQTGKIYFTANDDNSGITDHIGNCESVSNSETGERAPAITSVCGFVESEGGDKYSLEVRVGAWVTPGNYLIHFDPKRVIFDKARNYARSGQGTDLFFQVVSKGQPDTSGPDVTAVSVDPIIAAGNTGKIYFMATDDLSGITDHISGCVGVFSAQGEYTRAITAACGSVQAEGADQYSLSVTVGEWITPGKYTIHFNPKEVVFDKAQNMARSGEAIKLTFEVKD